MQNKIDDLLAFTGASKRFVILAIATISLASTAILIRLSLAEISVDATVFNRLWVASLAFGIWNGFTHFSTSSSALSSKPHVKDTYQLVDIVLLLSVALAHLGGRLLWTWSLGETSVANANVLGSLTPLFATIGGWLLFKQRFDGRFLSGLALALVGATALGLEDFFQSSGGRLLGDAAALLSAVFYAINFLILEHLRTKMSVKTILFCRCFMGALVMIPAVFFLSSAPFPVSLLGWLVIIALALVCECLGHGLVVYSLEYFSSGFVSLVLLLDPIIAALLAWAIFSENLSLLDGLSLGLILQGLYFAKTGQGAEKNTTPKDPEPNISEPNSLRLEV